MLLVVDDQRGNILIYLEKLAHLEHAILNSRHRRQIHKDKLGKDILLAFDEAKRMLVVCARIKVRGMTLSLRITPSFRFQLALHIFVFDEKFSALQTVGATVNLGSWYGQDKTISHVAFVCGSEELLLVDSDSQARIFSFVTQMFRWAVNGVKLFMP